MRRNLTFGFTSSAAVLLLAAALASGQEGHSLSSLDRQLVEGQKICPVTGRDLRAMGGPVKAAIEGQAVFLCCRGCLGRPLDPQHGTAAQDNLRTARLVLAQRICPVTGRDLSVDEPVKAQIGGQSVFLCSQGCFEGQIQKAHWDEIQTNLAAAQGKCPVMNKPLPRQSASTVLKGRRVFVCCPPCVEKMAAAPEKYLAAVDKLLAGNLEAGPKE